MVCSPTPSSSTTSMAAIRASGQASSLPCTKSAVSVLFLFRRSCNRHMGSPCRHVSGQSSDRPRYNRVRSYHHQCQRRPVHGGRFMLGFGVSIAAAAGPSTSLRPPTRPIGVWRLVTATLSGLSVRSSRLVPFVVQFSSTPTSPGRSLFGCRWSLLDSSCAFFAGRSQNLLVGCMFTERETRLLKL